ncbi:DUF2218 domain-containing protein [Rhizobium halophilum]|uniref:DUF2218 domain-containing protein n=1 Tax=Rhizobium halophilum TaxID=2846852 RepID=UPI001EFDD60C|nr:DUF2218 domain-containing protein [Rhizobium halophilum]MCF6370298.1 siderophore-interacting protein [Rhizobium halophilum]
MNAMPTFKLSGVALPTDPLFMLDEVCEHFVEHSEVQRDQDVLILKCEIGTADIRLADNRLMIDLTCPTEEALHLTRNMIAEHLFYFAGEEPFELSWESPPPVTRLPNMHEVTVVSAENVTPRMRRVKFACNDIEPFVDGDMHVRLLVPPKGRAPIWPGLGDDGRIAWPKGEDEILVRVYTIRAVDLDRRELWVDFVQHPAPGIETPGADFARDAQPGDKVALIVPGGGDFPKGETVLLAGDETALPAIARIAAEAPAGTRITAIIEVENEAEEQPLSSAASLEVQWLHRSDYPERAPGILRNAIREAIAASAPETYVWVACEKQDVRSIRAFLKDRGHDRRRRYVAWYWERGKPST